MLIDCALYKDGKRIKNITPGEIIECEYKSEKDFIWAAYVDPQPHEIEPLCTYLGVHELALEDIRHGDQLTKLEEYDEHVFIVVKQLILNAQQGVDKDDMYILMGPHYVVTVRKNIGQGFSNIRKRSERESKLLKLGPSYVVYAIIDTIVDRYFPVVSQFEKEVDALDCELFAEEPHTDKSSIIKSFHQAKEKVRATKLTIAPLTEFLSNLFGGRVPETFEGMDNYFRDIHDHLQRLTSILDNLHEVTVSGVHTSVALMANDDSKVTKKLASWAAIFGASTLMAGIWGMNFKHMPELDWEYGYPLALFSIVMVSGLLYRKFKKSGWV